jgi:hypothetical protein
MKYIQQNKIEKKLMVSLHPFSENFNPERKDKN